MTTCSKCGAENKSTADVCRMCGTPLQASAPAIPPPQPPPPEPSNSALLSGIPCPNCQTMNESDWAFCQQCGGKLHPTQDEGAAPRQAENPQEQATVVTPSPVNPELVERGFKTVPSQVPRIDGPEPSEQRSQAPLGLETVVDRTPIIPPPATQSSTEVVRSEPLPHPGEGALTCPRCGKLNSADSAFCANCGASIQIAKTIVMASVPPPPKGRLHLIMEGGQTGEIYDLKDETTIGRTAGDITFPHDGFMSGRHASIVRNGEKFILLDDDSRNGTFIRIKGEIELKQGDMVLIGRQLFRFEV